MVVGTGKIKYFFPSHGPANGQPAKNQPSTPVFISGVSFHNTAISPDVHPCVHISAFVDQVRTDNF